MKTDIKPYQIFIISEDIVVREIEEELIIVPIASGIGDMEDELYTMNETGKEILGRIDGEQSLKQIAQDLADEFNAPFDMILEDILGLVSELVKRRMLKIIN